MLEKTFSFKAKVWLTPGHAAWHFITVPENISEEIDFFFKEFKRGWGSLPVLATIGDTSWRTSIFFEKKNNCYLLPLKTEIRKAESVSEGDNIAVSLKIRY